MYVALGPPSPSPHMFLVACSLCVWPHCCCSVCHTPNVWFDKQHRLHEFFWFLKAPIPRGATEQRWMFPFAVQLIGWMHQWDLVVRIPLSQARWWPSFLESLKAITSFLRSKTYMPCLVRSLQGQGKHALANLVGNLSLPTFAAWRWRTLEKVCVELDICLQSLMLHFDPAPFRTTRAGAELDKVVAAFASPQFYLLFTFVLWFSVWIGGVQGMRELVDVAKWIEHCV